MMRGEEEEEGREREGGEEEEERRRRKGCGAPNALHDADGKARVRDGLLESVLSWTAWQQQAPLRRTRASIRTGKGRPADEGEEEEAAVRGLLLARAWGLLLDNGHMLLKSGVARRPVFCVCRVVVLGKG